MLHRSVVELILCVSGIYASFLTWAVLQERISTTPYGPDNKIFRASLVINTIQSFIASIIGYLYLTYKRRHGSAKNPVFPDMKTVQQYFVVSAAQSLSSPFAYASLMYVDYLTLLLAKSCKLLPVMALHLTIYKRTYPLYKYLVVASITIGVCLFTVYHPTSSSNSSDERNYIGLALLAVNLFLDGFYNSTQDHMIHENKSITGPHMMCGLNAMSTVLTALFLLTPFTTQLSDAIAFISEHPKVLSDIVLFGLCGGLGQVFIFHTLANYGSLVLVTVTVTRKMFSMLLSVVWFNHTLSTGQWLGVFVVFGGIGSEAYIKYREKKASAPKKTQ
ncbi:UDP-galactose transporter homolog 1 [Trichomonascus vanleenenianus]|uniref:UDP-galactose transporter HUT1 n=1 Tax=Trichomonascus vanleenenianus TaxID=2268995 RepID=UPI003EC9F9D0